MANRGYAGSIETLIAINPGNNALNLTGPEGDYLGAGYSLSNGFVYQNECEGAFYNTSTTNAKVSAMYFTGFNSATGSESVYFENGEFVASELQMDNS